MRRALGDDDLERRAHVTRLQMPRDRGTASLAEDCMRMHAWRSIRANCNIADQRGDLHLLADFNGLVLLQLPIKIRERRTLEGADGCNLGAADSMLLRERLKTGHR